MRKGSTWWGVSAFLLVLTALSATVVAATTKPAGPAKRPEALTKAIAELGKEYAAYAAKPETTHLREKADYFGGSLPAGVTQENVLEVLESPLPGGAGQNAYIKWQIVAGLPKADGPAVARLLRIYANAPRPFANISADPRTKAALEKEFQGKTEADVEAINVQYQQLRLRNEMGNDAIIAYRNTLYAKLPVSMDSLAAALEDIVIRINAGNGPNDFWKAVDADMQMWALLGAQPQQLSIMAGALTKLKSIQGPSIYTRLEWDEKGKKVKGGNTPKLDAKAIDKVIESFQAAANQGTLQFKDDKKK